MAAPTVGAVMADILPYLGVETSYDAQDITGQLFTLDDLTGLTAQEAEKLLKEQSLTARFSGEGDTVTGQIPAAGTKIPAGSQVLVYLGEPTEPNE